MQVRRKIPVLRLISYAQQEGDCRRERGQTCFSKIQPNTIKVQLLTVQHNFCSVTCYTVLIWTPSLLRLRNNILSQSFNWHKPVCCIPSDEINFIKRHSHSKSTNFGSWNSHSTNANFEQLRHITSDWLLSLAELEVHILPFVVVSCGVIIILRRLSLIHIWRCRRSTLCRSRWSPYH